MQGAPERAHGGVCLLQESVLAKATGSCDKNGEFFCSPNAASCDGSGSDGSDTTTSAASSSFFSTNATVCSVATTSFGRCGTRCAWSPRDCSGGETWSVLGGRGDGSGGGGGDGNGGGRGDGSGGDGYCRCDEVRVGACGKDGQFFCAVSEDACDERSTWIPPLDVPSIASLDCFLCRAGRVSVGDKRVSSTVGGVSSDVAVETMLTSWEGSGTSINKSLVYGGIAGGVLGLIVIFIVFSILFKRRKRYETKERAPTAIVQGMEIEKDDEVSVL